ncbi:chorismate-binding protein, partial [Rhodococcus phenolicus]|uniref:chorismate-binding protein n=1 Tax=Rhodococcus phenolicus TaxID=263849 RepID=UPI0012E8FDE3
RGTFTRPDRMRGPLTREDGPLIGGGWVGYLAYPDRLPTTPALPAAAGGWTDVVLRLDDAGCWWYETLTDRPCPPDLAAAVRDPQIAGTGWHIDWIPPDRAAHRHGVEQCLEAIRAGEVYQACVCGRFTGRWSGDPLAFFADAIEATRPNRRGDRVESGPIKGTLPLHRDPAELRASVKDVAENVMIVDLVRNDLGRVAETGTVTVPDLLGVHPAPGVWHLVSTVGATRPPAGPELNVAIRTVEFGAVESGTAECALGVGGGITIDSDPDAEWQECLDKAASILQLSPSTRPDPPPAARTAGAPR